MSTPNTPGGYPPYQGGGNPYDPQQPPQQPPSFGQEPAFGQQPQQPMPQQPAYEPQPPQQPSSGETQPYGQPSYGQPAPQPQPPSYGEQMTTPAQYGYAQPYSQPPMGQPMPPARKSRRGLWLTLGIIAAVLILACALVGAPVVKPIADKGAAIVAAATTAGVFCGDLKVQNYSGAYSQLSSAYQATISQDTFTQGAQLHDQIDGQVTDCTTANNSSSSGVSINDANTQVTLAVKMSRRVAYTGNVVLVKNGGTWKLDKIADTLQGTDLGPLQTANAFCAALVKGDFQTAYNQFSSTYQSQVGSEQDYASQLQSSLAGTGVTIAGCTPDLTSYSVTGDTATLKSTLNLSLNGQTQPLPSSVSFTKENGVWKISDLTIAQN